jgi:hypothetical protein
VPPNARQHQLNRSHKFSPLLRARSNISYSSYLLHFPLQLVLALAFSFGLVSVVAVRSWWMMIAFLAVLIPLSVFVYHFSKHRPRDAFDACGLRSRVSQTVLCATPDQLNGRSCCAAKGWVSIASASTLASAFVTCGVLRCACHCSCVSHASTTTNLSGF